MRLNIAWLLALGLVGCGGGGGEDAAPSPVLPDSELRTVTGAAAKGPLRGASVSFFAMDAAGNATGNALCGPVMTDNEARFTVTGCPAGQFLLAVTSGGSYVDEGDTDFAANGRTRRSISLATGEGFLAVLPPDVQQIALTPYSMALWLKAKRQAASSQAAFFDVYLGVVKQATDLFGFAPDSVIPADPLAPATGSTMPQKTYALFLGGAAYAINAIAARTGPSPVPTFADIQSFINDLSDGRLDGRQAGTVITQNGAAIPADVSLNGEVRRFRNNNDAAFSDIPVAPTLDEDQFDNDATPVAPANTAPTMSAISDLATNEDQATPAIAFTVSDRETPSALTVTATSSNLTLVPLTGLALSGSGANRSLVITPAADAFGTVTITLSVSDGSLSASRMFLLSVVSQPDAPRAADDNASTTEDQSVIVRVLDNDLDPDGDALTLDSVSSPQNGVATANADNTVTFTPATDFTGAAGFSYTVRDSTNLIDSADVIISVTAINDAPVVDPIARQTTDEDTDTAAISVKVTDVETPAGFSLSAVATPAGKVSGFIFSGTGSTRTLVVRPAADQNGSVSITVTATDTGGQSGSTTFTLDINAIADAPRPQPDSASTDEDKSVTIDVLANDTDPEGDALTVSAITAQSNGVASINPDGSIAFLPNRNYFGPASFSYRVQDTGGLSAIASVSVSVAAVNDAPSAMPDTGTVAEDGTLNVSAPGLLGNDSDVENESLEAVLETAPAHGILLLEADGSYSYEPEADFNGTDSFSYRARDSSGASSAPATVSLTITAVNDAPVADDQALMGTEDTALNLNLTLTASDVEGDTLTYTVVAGPTKGRLSGSGAILTYTPNADENGVDSFTFKANDGSADSNVATVSILIGEVNDAPVPMADSASTNEDTSVTIDVLANDSNRGAANESGQTLTLVLLGPPTVSGSTVSISNGQVIYSPAPNFFGTDSFSYTVEDDGTTNGSADPQRGSTTVTVTVAAQNDAPVAMADSFTVNENSSLAENVLTNDRDVEDGMSPSGTAIYISGSGPAKGGLVFNADGSFTYTPNADFNGADSFQYRLRDSGGALSADTLVNISVSPVNSAPKGQDQTLFINEDTAYTLLVSDFGFTDLNDAMPNQFKNLIVTRLPTKGTLSLRGAPVVLSGTPAQAVIAVSDINMEQLVYTPAANDNNLATPLPDFQFKVQDDGGTLNGGQDTSSLYVVTVNISPVNDAPVAGNDSFSTPQNTTLTINPPGVLSNDTDVESGSLSASLVAGPSNGSLTLNTDGSFSYMPNAGFTGSDSFTYQARDGANAFSNVATVSLTVTP